MATRKRRFKKGRIDFLSLCHRGANNLSTVYKGEGSRVVLKATEDRGEITALVYVPEHRDNQGEIASASVIKDMAYGFAQRGMALDLMHNEEPIDPSRAFVAEQFIVQKGDPRFLDLKDNDGKALDATGAWGVVIKVIDPALRALYRDGKWSGISMGGDGDFIDETKIGKADQENDMNEEQVTALVKKILAAFEAEKVEKAQKAATSLPVFKGDVTKMSAKDLREHAAKVRKAKLFADVDMNDPEAVEAVAKALEDEEAAKKKAKTSVVPPAGGKVTKTAETESDTDEDGDEDEDDTVEKGDLVEVDVPEGLSDEEARALVAKNFILSQIPDNRRVSKQSK